MEPSGRQENDRAARGQARRGWDRRLPHERHAVRDRDRARGGAVLLEGYIRLSLRSTAQPALHTRSPIISSSYFSKVPAIGYYSRFSGFTRAAISMSLEEPDYLGASPMATSEV